MLKKFAKRKEKAQKGKNIKKTYPKRADAKKRTIPRIGSVFSFPKKLDLLVGFFSRKLRSQKRRKRIVIDAESLDQFLREYQVKRPGSFGKKYLHRRYLSHVLFFTSGMIKKIAGFFRQLAWRGSAVVLLFIIACGTIPVTLSAPRAVSVATIEDWKKGEVSSVDVSDTNGQIQLQPDGSWNKRVWGVPQDGIENGLFDAGSSSVIIGNYIYITGGHGTRSWFRYDMDRDEYDKLKELPLALTSGADLGFDGDKTIYMTFGGYSKKFYKYDIVNESFVELPDTLDTICSGSNVEVNVGAVFVNRGCGVTDFWKFDINGNSWENLAPLPGGAGGGASLVQDQVGNFYLTRGSTTKNFYKYNISSGMWTVMPDTPGFTRFASAALAQDQKGIFYHNDVDGKNYVYYMNIWIGTPNSGVDNGIYTYYAYMMRYNINDNIWSSWAVSDDAPITSVQTSSMQYNPADGLIYVFRGIGSYDLWKFDPQGGTPGIGSGGAWVGPALINGGQSLTANSSQGGGSDLIWNGITGNGGYLYDVRGNNTKYFFRYDIVANTWSQLADTPVAITTSYMRGTYANGYVYYFRGGSSKEFYRYDVATNAWSATGTLADFPVTVVDGTSLVYNSGDGYIYASRGGWSNIFYRYDINLNTWTAMAGMSDSLNGFSSVGASVGTTLVSDGTSVYAIFGDGERAFLKYNPAGNSWSGLSQTPFVQYAGTDLTYAAGKIYALAGYFRDETWEYTIASNTWRKLPPIKQLSFERGPGGGASLEYAGGNSLYATMGNGISEVLSMTISSDNYASQGTYISEAIDLGNVQNWISFSKNDLVPNNTAIVYETRTSNDSKNWSTWQEINGTLIESTPDRFLQLRITLTSSDLVNTPTVADWSISYNSEDDPPENPSVINALSRRVAGTAISSGNSYVDEHPYFSWNSAVDAGSGVAGYYVYFGSDQNADPVQDGVFQQNTFYESNIPFQTGNYYLRIRTKDVNGNISLQTLDAFTYVYNGVSPSISVSRTSRVEFDSGTNTDVSTSSVDGSLKLSSVEGFWNESRMANIPTSAGNTGEMVKVNYEGTTYFYSVVGDNRTNFYRYDPQLNQWATMTPALANIYYGGELVEGPNGFLYALSGGATSTFMRYDIANNLWEYKASMPQAVTYGGTMKYDGSRYIYATPGNDNSFFRYDTVDNRWITLGTINFGNPEFTYQALGNGADSDYDGKNSIYITQGNGFPYFAKYILNDDPISGEKGGTWKPLAPSPVSTHYGGSITYDSATNSIYMLSGWGGNYFYKYDITSDSWTRLSDSPNTESYGVSSVSYDGYIYVQNANLLLRYNIYENSWDLPVRGIMKPANFSNGSSYGFGGGTAITQDQDGNAYLIRGSYDTLFYKYNPVTGKSYELAPLPIGSIDGAQLAYVQQENAVYYVIGDYNHTRRSNGRNNYFFKYDITTNTWQSLINDLPPMQLGSTGLSMVYDGFRYIYLTRASNTNTWWKYDTQAASGSRWSAALPTIAGWTQYVGSRLLYKNGNIYSTKGNSTKEFYQFSVSLNSWTRMADVPGNISSGSALVDGMDGYLYLTQGGNTSGYFRYKIADNTWEILPNIPAQVSYGGGGAGMLAGSRIWTIAGGGTNTYNDGLYSYVIGSTSNGTGYKKTGTYVSEPLDLIKVYGWANIAVNYTQEQNTFVLVETRSSADGASWSEWATASNERAEGNKHTYSIESPTNNFLQVKLTLSSTDQILSPQVDDYTVSYYQDIQAPTNPTQVSAYSDLLKNTNIESNIWYNHSNPTFQWPLADAPNGAFDGSGGSGVAGYYVYFGTMADADPFLLGTYQTENVFTPANLVSGNTYYLKITTIDNAGMVPASYFEAFTYKFDNVAPISPSSISVTPSGYTALDNYEFIWNSDASDASSGLAKIQYRTDGDDVDSWVDISDLGTVSVALPDAVNHPVGAYQPGKNKFYVRVIDNAGNASVPIWQDYYFSASAPSPPRNLSVDPTISEDNNFAFSWEQPESFTGNANKIKYRYSVNTLPNDFNTVETTLTAAGPGPFATQKGPNMFYVVAVDEAEKVDYSLYASVEFSAETSSPSVPVNVQVFDTSDREAQEYSAAIKWSKPVELNEGNFAGYVIYRSDDNVNFSEIAMTTGSAYVDTKIESKQYYYYVKSKDKTNNYSVSSTTLGIIPTGKYTRPPKLVGNVEAEVKAFDATFGWATDRVASSFVEYGKTISLGETTGQVDSVTSHSVIAKGLEAGTRYFYRVKYIDPDGNIGTSTVDSFKTLPPPTISEVAINDIKLDTAYVTWNTNASSICKLKYRGDGAGEMLVEEDVAGSGHVEKIEKLVSNTSYVIQIECLDNDGNVFSSDEYEFKTPEEPLIDGVSVQNKDNTDLPTVVVTYTTNVPTTTVVYFKNGSESTPRTFTNLEYVTEHSAELVGLDPSIEYDISIGGIDANGIQTKIVEEKITTRSDSRPPKILTNRAVGRVLSRGKGAQSNLYIKLEADEVVKLRVFYGKGVVTKSFEQSVVDDNLNTYHLITIPAESGQVYTYSVEASDETGNKTVTEPITIAVDQARANATEVVTGTFLNHFGWISKVLGK